MNAWKRIGYVPYSHDLQHPDDRRRFPHFASRQPVAFEIADPQKQYDVIILHASANLTLWRTYQQNHPHTKFIFEMVDSLIFAQDFLSRHVRGIARYILGKEKRAVLDYTSLLYHWLATARVVLCSNARLCDEAKKYNSRVLLSLDYLQHEYARVKTNYPAGEKLNLVWEGQGEILLQFRAFRDMLERLNSFCTLHVVTSPTVPRLGPFLPVPAQHILRELPIETQFHPWKLDANGEIFAQMDAAIIPLSPVNNQIWHKPANKLLSFWFSGLPVFCSNTPAYTAMARESGADILCSNMEEWVRKVEQFRSMTVAGRQQMADDNYKFACDHYGMEQLDRVWLMAFDLL